MTLASLLHLIQLAGKGSRALTARGTSSIARGRRSATMIERFACPAWRRLQRNAAERDQSRREGGAPACEVSVRERMRSISPAAGRRLARGALRAFQFSTGPACARSQIYARLRGRRRGKLDISGAFLVRGRAHCDTTLVVEHRVPRCTSRELFKGVLDEEARGVFQGKIIVSPGAQKTDGKQMAGALMLSEIGRVQFQARA